MPAKEPIAYYNGSYLPHDRVRISPDDRGFLFADGVYEVIRSYRGRLFAIEEHTKRLARSLKEVRIAWPAPTALAEVAAQLVDRNGLATADGTVYVQVTRGAAPRHHAFPVAGTSPTVYAVARSIEAAPSDWEDGVRIILVPDIRWSRCDIKSVALLPNVLAAQQAAESGATEAVFVRAGRVTEGTRTNVAALFDGVLVTHPADHHVLPGITRGAVLQLCREMGVSTREAAFTDRELLAADEVLLLGTTKEVTPVVRIGDAPVGSGRPGRIGRRLAEAYRELIERL